MPATVTRRGVVVLGAALFAALPRKARNGEFFPLQRLNWAEEWEDFKQLYVTAEGRVVDTGNQNCSHSEGQGWGLLLAEAFGDEACFNRILAWTRDELRRPYDSLHCWTWRPDRPNPIEDHNNAADGDIFIAWALSRAARRWARPELLEVSKAIIRDLHQACVREVGGSHVLLPAAFGFEHPGYVVLNPSYYVFPALPDLATLMPRGNWRKVRQDGLTLLRQTRFGRWGLPADWVELPRDAGSLLQPATGWAPRFSYDAVRVPLYMAWAGLDDEPAVQAASRFWSQNQPHPPPAWTELTSDQPAPYEAGPGIRSIVRLVQDKDAQPENLPRVREAPYYYGAALTLLARLAASERATPV